MQNFNEDDVTEQMCINRENGLSVAADEHDVTKKEAEKYVESLLRKCRKIRRSREREEEDLYDSMSYEYCSFKYFSTVSCEDACDSWGAGVEEEIEAEMVKIGANDIKNKGCDYALMVNDALDSKINSKKSSASDVKDAVIAKRGYLKGFSNVIKNEILKYVSCLSEFYYSTKTEHSYKWEKIVREGMKIQYTTGHNRKIFLFNVVNNKGCIFNKRIVHSIIGQMIECLKYGCNVPQAAEKLGDTESKVISHDMHRTFADLGFNPEMLKNLTAEIMK